MTKIKIENEITENINVSSLNLKKEKINCINFYK